MLSSPGAFWATLASAATSASTCRRACVGEIARGADVAVITEESIRTAGARDALTLWVTLQPAWSDFPFILLTEHGGGLERNPAAAQLTNTLGNVSFIERPFHPTTLVSVVQTSLRGRRRQIECRRLNDQLEFRVDERTAELAAANRQLLAQIAERERVETTLRQMQRLEAVGQLTSGVAHDFNNLLTVILGNVTFLEKGFAVKAGVDGKLMRRLGYMRAAAERGAKLTDQLLSFSRRQRLEPKVVDLNGVVAGMRDLLKSTMGGSIQIETTLQNGLWLAMVDPTQLELAILNLAINARDAMEVGGALMVETANVTLGPPQCPEEPPAGEYVVDLRLRHRYRHVRRGAAKGVRAVFHDQGYRQGLGARTQPGARLCKAIRRRRAYRGGAGWWYSGLHLPAAHPTQCRRRHRAAGRHG